MPTLGNGTKLKIGVNSIAELETFSGLDVSADSIDTTPLDNDGWKTFMQGLKDAGEVSFQGFFNPADTNGQKALWDSLGTGTVLSFTVVFPSSMGAEWNFNAFVTGFKTDVPKDDKISFDGKLKITGQPSLGLTASGGLTALVLTGTGGTLSPAFANGTYYYTFSGVSATSVTVTATAASHTLKLYIDGVYSQDLTSGSASAAIALTLNVGKKLTIIAYEAGKTQKVYEVIAVKTI